jgi:DNA-binding MurR/RpiR family transcriptional regulator
VNDGAVIATAAADRVLDLFHGVRLTPTQRRIAHSLVQHATSAAYLSAAEVAELARVSQPSVTRFAIALGYDGYPALRRRLLAGSRPLPVLGLRAAAPLAAYFAYFAAKVLPDVRVLDAGGSLLTDRLDQARLAGASALLAIVLPRYPRESLAALREARDAGLAVVAITDSPVSPAAEYADIVLPAAVGAQLVFDLHAAPMALAMVLLQAMCDAAPAQSQARLEEFEASAARRAIFVG